MKSTHSNTIKEIEKHLEKMGYTESNIQLCKKKGRNNIVFRDVANDLFIKIYSDSETMINSVRAQKIIEKAVSVPKMIYFSQEKISNTGFMGVWDLIKNTRTSDYNDPSNTDLQKISKAIQKIHEIDSIKSKIGPHFPSKHSGLDWVDYLKKWVAKSINTSSREIRGHKKKRVVDCVNNYLEAYEKQFNETEIKLLHGDIDISNFLFTGGGELSTTDLDYSIYGDPAWEFASAVANWKFSAPCYKDMLEIYLKARNFDQKQKTDFGQRVEFYGPVKKAVLIYAIKDISSLSQQEEMDLCLHELNISYI